MYTRYPLTVFCTHKDNIKVENYDKNNPEIVFNRDSYHETIFDKRRDPKGKIIDCPDYRDRNLFDQTP